MSAEADVSARLEDRLEAFSIHVSPAVVEGCVEYLRLLARWNRRINLTALPLEPSIPKSTLDKLIVEPLCALDLLPAGEPNWVDLGSGGGSPALPLRLAFPRGRLALVEARERKCAFLKEAIRTLKLTDTAAYPVRFADFLPSEPVDVLTVRAVRLDAPLLELLQGWLAPAGRLISFGATVESSEFTLVEQRDLPDATRVNEYRVALR